MSSFSDPVRETDEEFVVSHEADAWIARRSDVRLRAANARELDRAIIQHVRGTTPPDALPVAVALRFDNTSLPRWMHQYAAHYFNRKLHVEHAVDPGDN